MKKRFSALFISIFLTMFLFVDCENKNNDSSLASVEEALFESIELTEDTENMDAQPVDDILLSAYTFVETNPILQQQGYNLEAKTDLATCFFSSEDIETNISTMEKMDNFLASLLHSSSFRPTKVYLSSTDDLSVSMNELVLPEEAVFENPTGAVAYYASELTLPAWMSIGLEYLLLEKEIMSDASFYSWVEQVEMNQLPIFGDAWTMPDFFEVDTKLQEMAYQVAAYYTQHLQKTNQLEKLLSLYKEDAQQADMLHKKLWVSLSQSDYWDDLDASIRYVFGNSEQTIRYTYADATYHWMEYNWTYNLIKERTDYVTYGIASIKEWFDLPYIERPFNFYFYPFNKNMSASSGFATSSKININNAIYSRPFVETHEAVHYFIDMCPSINNAYLPFEEGIASCLMHEIDKSYHGTTGKANMEYINEMIRPYEKDILEIFAYYDCEDAVDDRILQLKRKLTLLHICGLSHGLGI